MRVWKRLLRILRVTAFATLALIFVAAATITAQQYLLRHRAERFLADYKTLRLGQTSWPETQAFIHRWQHWGYTSQPCASAYCTYTVDIGDTISMHMYPLSRRAEQWLQTSHLRKLLNRLGHRESGIHAKITVINGLLISNQVEVFFIEDNFIGMSLRSQPNFSDEEETRFDYETQMADHSDYFVGRPGGCEGCMIGWVHFTPHISNEQYAQITDFQLDCFTRRRPCEQPQAILPMIAPYHLYDRNQSSAPVKQAPSVCPVAPHTLGRDADLVLVVDALSTEQHKLDEYEQREGYEYGEHVKVSWVAVLKGNIPPGLKFMDTVMPYPGMRADYLDQAPEHMLPGMRYILFWTREANKGVATLGRCGFILDTPKNRQSVLSGISEDSEFESPRLHSDIE